MLILLKHSYFDTVSSNQLVDLIEKINVVRLLCEIITHDFFIIEPAHISLTFNDTVRPNIVSISLSFYND